MPKRYTLDGGGVALVTGASSGLGVEFALALAQKGYDVALVARRKERLEAAARHLEEATGRKAHVIAMDLGKSTAPKKLLEKVQDMGLDVSLVVNNAGFGWDGPYTDMSPAKQNEMIQLNITALAALTQLFLPGLIERGGGGVINVSSIASYFPMPRHSVYAATKAFVTSYSSALSVEMEEHGVRVHTICPGPTLTEFSDVAGIDLPGMENMMMSAREVVRIGLRGFDRGDVVTTTGAMNEALIRSRRLVNEEVLARVAHFFLKRFAD